MIQIQPQYVYRSQWEALARREDLAYEALEFSVPPLLDGEGAFERCRDSCALALSLGARQIVFHSSAFPFLRGAYLNNWAGVCGEFYMELADAYGLVICVENSMDLDPEPLWALLRETSADQVQVCLDVGHAHYARAPLEMRFERLGNRIGYLHLSDNNGQFDEHLPLGTGSVNWALADSLWR